MTTRAQRKPALVRGPQLPAECRTCEHYNPDSEAYACEVCPVNEGKARECHVSACPHWRTGNECMHDGLCSHAS